MLNIVDYIDSDEESADKSSNSQTQIRKRPSNVQETSNFQETQNKGGAQTDIGPQPPSTISWHECYDESTGYAYYWNVTSGEVTWDEPEEVKRHKVELEHYQQLLEANRRGLAVAAAAVLLKHKRKEQLSQQIISQSQSKLRDEKDNESEEDERIEMITSYGNDTQSDSESDLEAADKSPQAKKTKISGQLPEAKRSKKANDTEITYGPELPVMNYNLSLPPPSVPDTKSLPTCEERENGLTYLRQEASCSDSESSNNEEDTKTDEDLIAELKHKALLLQKLGGEIQPELKLILDMNETVDHCPAVGNQLTRKSSSEKESIVEDGRSPVASKKTSLLSLPQHGEKKTMKLKLSARGKALIEASITTQKARAAKLEPSPTVVAEVKPNQVTESESDIRHMSSHEQEYNGQDTVNNVDGCNVEEITALLKLKLSCLCSEEKKQTSDVQRTKIELETLSLAYEANALSMKYLISVCVKILQKLNKLEQEMLPKGWSAEWDRTNSRYFYFNKEENVKHSTLPSRCESDGEEDMDLCTTPPHSPGSYSSNSLLPVRAPLASSPALPPVPGVEEYVDSTLPVPPPPSQSPPSKPPLPPSYKHQSSAPTNLKPHYSCNVLPSPPPHPPPPPSYSPPPPPSYSPPPVPPPPPPILSRKPEPPTPAPLFTPVPKVPPTPAPLFTPVPKVLSQVPPPSSGGQSNKLLSELDSFYSDIASMTEPENSVVATKEPSSSSQETEDKLVHPSLVTVKKKKKSTKVAPVLSMKKKNVSSMVAKWQQVQQDM